jgi:hypothetical protein
MYANFLQHVNSSNGLLLAEDFNNLETGYFNGLYTYPKDLYTKVLSIGMKKVLKENGIHPHPLKFIYGMQQCTSQCANKESHIEHIEDVSIINQIIQENNKMKLNGATNYIAN